MTYHKLIRDAIEARLVTTGHDLYQHMEREQAVPFIEIRTGQDEFTSTGVNTAPEIQTTVTCTCIADNVEEADDMAVDVMKAIQLTEISGYEVEILGTDQASDPDSGVLIAGREVTLIVTHCLE